MVKDITPGEGSSFPLWLTEMDGNLFFSATESDIGLGQELWRSNGTEIGTRQVKDIWPGILGSDTAELTVANDALFFSADDGSLGRELWKSDGTEGGTILVKDIHLGSGGSGPIELITVNDRLFFSAEDVLHGRELWALVVGSRYYLPVVRR